MAELAPSRNVPLASLPLPLACVGTPTSQLGFAPTRAQLCGFATALQAWGVVMSVSRDTARDLGFREGVDACVVDEGEEERRQRDALLLALPQQLWHIAHTVHRPLALAPTPTLVSWCSHERTPSPPHMRALERRRHDQDEPPGRPTL